MSGRKCPLCGREYENGRGLHAHMLKAHVEEYRAAGCRVENVASGSDGTKTFAKKEKKEQKEQRPSRPAGLRPLRKTDRAEAAAYEEGFRYTDGENAYTAEECQEAGWL